MVDQSYHRGVRHFPLVVLGETAAFLVVDGGAPRQGKPDEDCDFFDFGPAVKALQVAL